MLSLLMEHRLIVSLLSVSAALHGGVLLYKGDGQSSIRASSETPINITLIQPSPAANVGTASPVKQVKTERKKQAPSHQPGKQGSKSSTGTAVSQAPVKKHPVNRVKKSTQPPRTVVASVSKQLRDTEQTRAQPDPPEQLPEPTSAAVHSQLRTALQSRLRFNHYYPRSAIRRGWEGRVDLAIRLDTQGQIGSVRVLKSSGHYVLDQAAINSVEQLEQLPEAVSLLELQSIELTLPVIYRLE